MRRILMIGFTMSFMLCFEAFAGVVFLPNASESIGLKGSAGNAERCKSAGYTYTSCSGTWINSAQCPWNNSYYSACCIGGLKYTTSTCKGTSPNVDNCSSAVSCGD